MVLPWRTLHVLSITSSMAKESSRLSIQETKERISSSVYVADVKYFWVLSQASRPEFSIKACVADGRGCLYCAQQTAS